MFLISPYSIETSSLSQGLSEARAGALVTFEGWVRNHHEGKEVLHLEYEAYEALCISEALALEAEVKERYDIIDISCVHRVGHCDIGELAVWIGVTAEHRGPAFDACEHYIDALKVRLPIWKKESFVDGRSDWVRCEHCDAHAHQHGHHHHHAHSH